MNNEHQDPLGGQDNALQSYETLLKLREMPFGDKIEISRKGLSKNEVLQTIDHFQLEADELSWLRMMNKGFLQLQDGDTAVDREMVDRIVAFADIWSIGVEVFGSPNGLLQWLRMPNELLGYVPIRIMDTIIGLQEIKKELRLVEHSNIG